MIIFYDDTSWNIVGTCTLYPALIWNLSFKK